MYVPAGFDGSLPSILKLFAANIDDIRRC